jgi:hypothetical protein
MMTDELALRRYDRANWINEIDPADALEAAKGWFGGYPDQHNHAIAVVASVDPETNKAVFRVFEGGPLGVFAGQGLLLEAIASKLKLTQ